MTPEQAVIARERDTPPPPEPRQSPLQEAEKEPPRRRQLARPSDDRLAKWAGRGDPDAFAAIFRRYEGDLYRYCVGILGEPQDAQDAIQNTIVKVLRALPGECRDIQLKPWLYRIAHNEAVELRRRQRPVEQLTAGIADAGPSVDEHAERSERLQVLFRDMTDLPERQRAALVMRELSGLEFGEIGAALETSPSAVRQTLYEARCGLQQMELGRHMDCDAVTRVLSDEDRRVHGRREIRAHLRHCSDCRRFQRGMGDRKRSLAAISPLPAFVAGSLLNGGLAGSVAAGGSAGAGGAGEVAGLLGGTAVSSGLAKSVAGFLAVVAIGTAAADRTGLIDLQGRGGTAVERKAGAPDPSPRGTRGVHDRGGIRQSGLRLADANSMPVSLPGLAASGHQGVERPDQTTAPNGLTGSAVRSVPSSSGAVDPLPAQAEPGALAAGPIAAPDVGGEHPPGPVPENGTTTAGKQSDSGHPDHPPHPEKGRKEDQGARSESGPKNGSPPSSEAKTEKKEAKTEKEEAKAEAETEKAEAKPGRGPKSEAKGGAPAPAESSPPSESSAHPAHPEHPPHPEQSQNETPAPEVEPAPVVPEPTEVPTEAGPGNGNGNGKGSKREAAAPSE